DALRGLLTQGIAKQRKQALHLRMASALLVSTAPEDRMARVEAGWQLVRGGDELRGAQLLQRTAMEFEIGTGSLQAAIPALEEARRVYLEHGRSLYELLPIVARLATEGYYSDRRLSTLYAEEAFALLSRASGLGIARRLQPWIGRKLGVYVGLMLAALRFFATPRARRLPRFGDVFFLLVNCVTTQAGAGAVCVDAEAIRRAAAFIEPMTALGPRHITSAIHEYCLCLLGMGLEQQPEVHAGWIALLHKLEDRTQFEALPDYVRQLYRGGALFALGLVETWRDGEAPLSRAHELEALGLRIYDRAAYQIRMLYHAGRGELEQAEQCRRRMELHAIQTGSAWQVEVTVPSTLGVVYSALGDVVRLKRVAEQLEQLAARLQVPSLRRTATLSRAAYLLLAGNAEEALVLSQRVLESSEVRGFVGRARAVGTCAAAYNQLGRHAEALRVCEGALQHVRAEDRPFVRMFLSLEVQHALALAGLGRSEEAARALELLIAEHAPAEGPLTLGLLHEARAQVALLARDHSAFRAHAEATLRWFRPTGTPALVARAERLAQHGVELLALEPPARSSLPVTSDPMATSARSVLSQCSSENERCDCALELLLTESGANEGHLFIVGQDGELELRASHGVEPPPLDLRREVGELLSGFREGEGATRFETHSTALTQPAREPRGEGNFRTHLLWCVVDDDPELIGVAAVRGGASHAIDFHFLQALADALHVGRAAR
ncbi:MAG TPA: hypothetical protein VK509_06390, partial [Polyangiales bacterium]|nr:hypothetical protein [Polyangiales bacterium]